MSSPLNPGNKSDVGEEFDLGRITSPELSIDDTVNVAGLSIGKKRCISLYDSRSISSQSVTEIELQSGEGRMMEENGIMILHRSAPHRSAQLVGLN